MNSDGSDIIKPYIVGLYQNSRCFVNIDHSSLTYTYCANGNAWMVTNLFEEFLNLLNVHFRLDNKNIDLILNNDSTHVAAAKKEYSNIKLFFLPPNTTIFLQPLDNGIIASIKKRFWSQLSIFNSNHVEINNFAPINLKEALDMFCKCHVKTLAHKISYKG